MTVSVPDWINAVASVLLLFVSIAATWLVFIALRATQKISIVQTRAYVSLQSVQARWKDETGDLEIGNLLRNSGQSPAKDVKIWHAAFDETTDIAGLGGPCKIGELGAATERPRKYTIAAGPELNRCRFDAGGAIVVYGYIEHETIYLDKVEFEPFVRSFRKDDRFDQTDFGGLQWVQQDLEDRCIARARSHFDARMAARSRGWRKRFPPFRSSSAYGEDI